MTSWCCDWFNLSVEYAGDKGITVAASYKAGVRAFYLIARFFDPEIVEEFSRVDERTGRTKWPALIDNKGYPVPLTITMAKMVRFCPGCGANLERLISKKRPEFDELVEKHRQYFSPG